MFVLDTNVVSEMMRERPDAQVLAWLDSQPVGRLFITAITAAEIRTGISLLPDGQMQRLINAAAERALGAYFTGRILPFDSEAAHLYALIAADRRAEGRPISQTDCQIAAIARSRGAAVVTRNVDDYAGCGIEILDPWSTGVI